MADPRMADPRAFADPLASAPPPPASARFPAPPPETESGFMPPPPPGGFPPPPSGFAPPPTGAPTGPGVAGWAAPRASERVEMAPPPPTGTTEPPFRDTVVVEPIRVDTIRANAPEAPTAPRVVLDDSFPEDTDDWDATRMVSRPPRTRPWNLTLPDGTVEEITQSVIIGRAATEMDDWSGARLVSISDATRSISKNHAVFAEKFGMFVVEDLGSTNGIVIVRPDGEEHVVPPFGRADLPEGAIVELGAVVLRVGRAPAPTHRF